MQARLFRLGLTLPETTSVGQHDRGALSKAEQMACFIAEHYLEPLSTDDIAAEVHLHPNYAMGLFRRVF